MSSFKGKSVPAADETIHPDVKPGTALGNRTAMKSDLYQKQNFT